MSSKPTFPLFAPEPGEQEAEPEYSKAFRARREIVFYKPNIDTITTPEVRALLEDYSQIPAAKVSQHVHTIHDEAWSIRTYPRTGLGAFLKPLLPLSPAYSTIVSHLQSGGSFLDVGYFIGRDLRQLVFDGAPSDRLYDVDIVSHWDVGYNLFRDRDKFQAHIIECDILRPKPGSGVWKADLMSFLLR